jgi:hypothetical protein
LVLEPNLIEAPEFSLLLDGGRYAGAGALRLGARPALGLGLSIDALSLDGVLSESLSWQEAAEALQGFDANLRLTAGKVEWQGQALEGVALEATLDAGRLSLQRFSARQGSASLSASGSISLGAAPSLTDAALEIAAPMASALPPLLSEALNLPGWRRCRFRSAFGAMVRLKRYHSTPISHLRMHGLTPMACSICQRRVVRAA